jgi:hypothetical protein
MNKGDPKVALIFLFEVSRKLEQKVYGERIQQWQVDQ